METFQFFNQKQQYFEKKAATKTGNHIGLGLLVFIGVYLISQIVLGVLLGGGIVSFSLLSDPVFNAIYSSCISILSFLGGGFVILAAESKSTRNLITFEKPKSEDFPLIVIGIGVCFAASYVVSVVASLLKDTVLEPKMHDTGMPEDTAGFLAYLLMVTVIPAICEEFLFRGAILQSLRKFGDATALTVSTVLFALMHGNLVQIPFALAAGFFMGYAALKTGGLVMPMLIHFSNNLLATLFTYFSVISNSAALSRYFDLLELAIIVTAIVLAVLYVKKHGFTVFRPQLQITSPAILRAKIIFVPAAIPFLCYVALNIFAAQISG